MIVDVHHPFRVVSDASDTAIGAVLLQEDDTWEWYPVGYTSRRFRREESNYTIMERERLAAIYALRIWRLYLFNHFELVTDNQGARVVCLNSKKNLTKREARWIKFLVDYNVEIVRRPGKDNMADPFSRITDEGNDQVTSHSESHFCSATDCNDYEDNVVSDVGETEVSVCAEPKFKGLLAEFEWNSKDKKMERTIDRLKRNPKLEDPNSWNSLEERLYLQTDVRQRMCIPAGPLCQELLKLCHDIPSSGHPGRDRTYSSLARSFFWPRMSQYVKRHSDLWPYLSQYIP